MFWNFVNAHVRVIRREGDHCLHAMSAGEQEMS